ncbi:hypothetical protein J0X19_20015 [Hymenobacter sp. BT186]|uniref:Uncharacterized protein n=1 Tax=Hymenobacter telluris TaxID=2816474 RepID=A0A939EZZ9_9BACT|nr:DUF6756 family protein [Hymenobacter telluris]MBO0360256.1 hypothetical protein [Hymenobacter telluris]MBW3376283.1 hypothetical protein [Hymenobacter norwichensis]
MWTVEGEIQNALDILELSSAHFKRLDTFTAKQIVEQAKAKYVIGNPRSWWLSLKVPYKSYEYDLFTNDLSEYIPDQETECYWIPESEEEYLSVYDTRISVIRQVLENTPFFEYYVLSKKIEWLLIENDHNELIVIVE